MTRSVYAERVAQGYFTGIAINRDAIARHGLTVGDVQDVIEAAIGGQSREARALRLALSILALRVSALLARQLGLLITGWVLDAATIVVLLALVVVFQPELRRALMRLDVPGHVSRESRIPVVSAVSLAAWSLAQRRCGALMVLVQRDSISELVTTGVRLDGRVSAEILEAVFQKGSAVHDGAAIIEGDTLSRVGVICRSRNGRRFPSRTARGIAREWVWPIDPTR